MIKKYRKKPVEVEAVQWTGNNFKEVDNFSGMDNFLGIHYEVGSPSFCKLLIKTLEGTHHASIGDYIIKGVKGEFYPCKPDIFEKTYEEADKHEPLTLDELISTCKTHRTCSVCTKTDGIIYSSSPPMVRCTVDGKFHALDSECTLNLDNEPLTLDELREMDGEPVWIVEYPNWGHWELSEEAEDYLADRDCDYYGMTHNDPAGRYGLHKLGWLAYRHKPKEGF